MSAARTPRSEARWRSTATCSSGLLMLTLVSMSSRPGIFRSRAEASFEISTTRPNSGPRIKARIGKKLSPPPSADGIMILWRRFG